MKVCPRCDHKNSDQAVTCGNCGQSLRESILETLYVRPKVGRLERDKMEVALSSKDTEKPAQQIQIPDGAHLRVHLSTEPKPLHIPLKRELVIGRRDPSLPQQPDIDLSPYSGYRMGISRRHARINYTEEKYLFLVDLGSSNGTYLNDARLEAHHSYQLKEGDEIRLGQLIIVIYYDRSSGTPAKAEDPAEAARQSEPAAAQDSEKKPPVHTRQLTTSELPPKGQRPSPEDDGL